MSLRNGDYTPPQVSQVILGSIPLSGATKVPHQFDKCRAIFKLSGGQLYIEADMDIDADGSPRAKEIDPGNGLLETAFNYQGFSGQGKFVDAERVPYVVLPGGFFKQFGIKVGDLAVVVYKDRCEYAIFADVGPPTKMGEGQSSLRSYWDTIPGL